MFRRILVPLDGSVISEGILVPIRRLVAGQGEVELELLLVVEGGDPGGLDSASIEARTYLNGVRQKLEKEGITATGSLEQGTPAERILSRVQVRRPDLVAMATHGRTGLKRLVRGSVAEQVLRGCPAPILLVNPRGVTLGEARNLSVVVPLDGSSSADRILDDVASLSSGFQRSAVLLRVESQRRDRPMVQQAMDRERVEQGLKTQRSRLEEAGFSVRVETVFGKPAQEILAAAQRSKADLIAMTTHGRGGVYRLRFGSVAESVLRECKCPVLVRRS